MIESFVEHVLINYNVNFKIGYIIHDTYIQTDEQQCSTEKETEMRSLEI